MIHIVRRRRRGLRSEHTDRLHLVRQLCTHHPLSSEEQYNGRGISEGWLLSTLVNRTENVLLGTYGGPSNNYNPLRYDDPRM